jgi:hypothetical protein
MHFRLNFDLPFLAICEDREFELSLPSEVGTIAVKFSRANEKHHEKWKCEACCSAVPKESIRVLFEALSKSEIVPKNDWESFGLRGLELLGPPAYRQFVDKIASILSGLTKDAVSLLQWRLRLTGSHSPLIGGGRLWWSLDGNAWRAIPGIAGSAAADSFALARVPNTIRGEIAALVGDGLREPLGHELLREALQSTGKGARSAFVVAVMAAEVGVKQYISEILPETEWLLSNMPSPPLVKLLEEQIPRTPAKLRIGENVIVPLSIRETIKKAVQIRNEIVHKGKHARARDLLPEVTAAVRDLLYLLDYYRGISWAIHYVSSDVRAELESLK